MNKLLDFFKTKPREKPMDLDNFEEARNRLYENIKGTVKELDAFASMVLDMRGLKKSSRKTKPR